MFKVADPNSIVLVELNNKGRQRTVAFRPDEERGLMVGSDIRADFRVSGLGVAAVAAIAFHLERRDGTAWLVPAYELGDLRVNTAHVTGPLPLEERNVIEFGEVRIDVAVLDGGRSDCSGESSASSDDAWDQGISRSSEPPSEDELTLVAMRAVGRPRNSLNHQTTSVLRPIDAAALAPQQTERMAPYRPPAPPTADPQPVPVQITERLLPVRSTASDLRPAVTAHGTEIMAPYRPSRPSEDPDGPPPTVRTGKPRAAAPAPAPHYSAPTARAPESVDLKRTKELPGVPLFSGSAVLPQPLSAPIVPVPVVAVSLGALAKVAGSPSPSNQVSDGDTTLFEMPVVYLENIPDAQGPNAASAPDHARSPTHPDWSNDETHRAVARTLAPAARILSWLEKLGLLAKARPALVACGVAAGACALTTGLLVATSLTRHRETHSQETVKSAAARSVVPPRAVVAAAPAPSEPIQIIEFSSAPPASSASRAAPPPAAKKTPSDPELAAAVADVIAGRYSEARAAYAALSPRTDNAKTYATVSRLLARTEHAECSGNGPGAPKDCPGVHR